MGLAVTGVGGRTHHQAEKQKSHPRNRVKKRASGRRRKKAQESSSDDDNWDRDKELGLPRRDRLSGISEEEESPSLERGKKARQRSRSSSNASLVGVKLWRKKKEEDRQKWLDQNEKPMHHKKAQQEIKQEQEEDEDEPEEDSEETSEEESVEEGGTPSVKEVKVDKGEEKGAPEMGAKSEQASSSDKKAEGSTTTTSEKRRKHVMIDFHNTLETGDKITAENHAAVEQLLLTQHQVTICSWCFQKREQEVRQTLQGQTWFGELSEVLCIQQRTGHGGKAKICLDKGIQVLMDDAADICKEAFEKGLDVYPIQTRVEKHQWWESIGRTAYPTLAAAVKAFLETGSS